MKPDRNLIKERLRLDESLSYKEANKISRVALLLFFGYTQKISQPTVPHHLRLLLFLIHTHTYIYRYTRCFEDYRRPISKKFLSQILRHIHTHTRLGLQHSRIHILEYVQMRKSPTKFTPIVSARFSIPCFFSNV